MRCVFRILLTGFIVVASLWGTHASWAVTIHTETQPSVSQFPAGPTVSQVIAGQPFSVYTQIYVPELTSIIGQTVGIQCTLRWSPVDRFEGIWQDPVEMTMAFSGDIGDRDEYRATIALPPGLYDYQTDCIDQLDEVTFNLPRMGHLIVTQTPQDQQALWFGRDLIAWNISDDTITNLELHYQQDQSLSVPIRAGEGIRLEAAGMVTGSDYPNWFELLGYRMWRVPTLSLATLPNRLDTPMVIAAYDKAGDLVNATRVQVQTPSSPTTFSL